MTMLDATIASVHINVQLDYEQINDTETITILLFKKN